MVSGNKALSSSNKSLLLSSALLFGLSGCGDSSKDGSELQNTIDTNTNIQTESVTRKALVIGIDGLMYDYVDEIDNPELNEPPTPNFNRFTINKSFAGGLLNTSTHQPSLSGPSWSSILTGTWADAHGVRANNEKAVEVPSVFRILKQRDPSLMTGSFVSWTPINSGHMVKEMPNIDRRVDGAYRPEGESVDQFIVNQLVTELESENSNLNFIFTHLDEVDGAGHACGWCERYETTLSSTDVHLGRIMAAIDQREINFNEEWLVMIISDHGHLQNGGHGGDSLAERTSVIGVNKPELFNEFFTIPAAPLNLSDNEEQNTLMGYPAITSVVPTVMTYLGHSPVQEDHFASPSMIGELGTNKLVTQTIQDSTTNAKVNLRWQSNNKHGEVRIYRNDIQIGLVSASETAFTDTVTYEDLGEGEHTIIYSIQGNIGSPLSSRVSISMAEPVDLGALVAQRETLISFNGTSGSFGWVSEASPSPTYVEGPFSRNQAINLRRDQGYLSQTKDLSEYEQITFGFRFRINGNFNDDPNLLSNKDWSSGYNPGMVVAVSGDTIKLNIGDGYYRADTRWLPLVKDQWVFAVVSIDLSSDQIALYTHDDTHGLQSAFANTGSLSSIASTFPLNIGEGGNGNYNVGSDLNFDISDLIVFNRALTLSEAHALAKSGIPLSEI